MSPTMESIQKQKPKFKASLTTPKPQSPTKQNQQQQALSFDQQDNAFINDALLALDGANNGGNNNNINKQKYFDSFPPGYRFYPDDEELIVYYLMKRVANEKLPLNNIRDVNLYKHNPSQLTEKFPTLGENEWYFFTPRDRKYPNGSRPNRAAGDGYWKATGADKPLSYNGEVVGYRKVLVFYKGKPPNGDKTQWIMHEFRVKAEATKSIKGTDDMRLDDCVLCKIYQKSTNGRRGKRYCNEEPEEIEDPKAPTPPSVPSSLVKMTNSYNPVGGSNGGFMANANPNPLVSYPQMPCHNNPLVPAEMPQYLEGSSISNYARFNAHDFQQPLSFNYEPALPVSSFRQPPPPPPHPTDNMPMPGLYMKGDMVWGPTLEEGDFLYASDFASQFDYNKFDMDFQDLPDDGSSNPSTAPSIPEDGI